jgi:hypothetical protein
MIIVWSYCFVKTGSGRKDFLCLPTHLVILRNFGLLLILVTFHANQSEQGALTPLCALLNSANCLDDFEGQLLPVALARASITAVKVFFQNQQLLYGVY